ncbi:glutathione S-transferase [Methylovorus sp. MM2]|uniref:glutathione S-transferase N-terminal domain-containing protein n=1 Tax=Methylovorus sp. MM2 TaxID=1848038 RepID=UPI0007E18FDE|nr:glutathione S-transferase N-terminal domain-containing protein [Methylovorus sp. MM2]OAM51384.1 glutathione S-transferase [Methylovorus sp. MM2]
MKLLYSLTSPYARKIRIVAAEKRIDIDMVQVVLASPDSPVANHNPLGKIPVLILDDGDSLFDSRVIAEFLDHRTPVAHLIPQDHSLKIKVKRWEALADGVCDAAVMAVNESRRVAGMQDAAVIAKQYGKVERGLKALSDDLGDAKWCVDDAFSLADIALGCALGYLELRCQHIDWKAQYPNLADLYAELMKRPSFKQSVPPAN